MKYAVIVLGADGVINAKKQHFKDPIEEVLKRNGFHYCSLQLDERPKYNDEIFADALADRTPIIISGGFADLTADIDWVDSLQTFVTKAIENGNPILGICFGAQIIFRSQYPDSLVYGIVGEVGQRTYSFVLEAEATPLKHLMGNPVCTFHFDGIKWDDRYEERFDCLSVENVNDIYVCEAFKMKEHNVYGVQFHAEFGSDAFCDMLRQYEKSLKEQHSLNSEQLISSMTDIKPYDAVFADFLGSAE